MATVEPIRRKSRILRTEAEIFAAGFEAGAKLAPLTEDQVNLLAALFAPTLNAARDIHRSAA